MSHLRSSVKSERKLENSYNFGIVLSSDIDTRFSISSINIRSWYPLSINAISSMAITPDSLSLGHALISNILLVFSFESTQFQTLIRNSLVAISVFK